MQHPAPEQYQPPLRWYSHLWRIAAAVLVGAAAWAEVAQEQWRDHRALFWLDLGLGVLALVLLQYRRRWPFPIAVVVTAFGAVSATSMGPALVATVSLATWRRWPQIIAVGAFGVVVGQTFVVVQPVSEDSWWLAFAVNLIVTVAIMAIGMYIGSRRELLWTLRERAKRAEAEQGLRVAQAKATERARIAREMHDVLAHRISLVTMHSGALSYRTDLTPAEVRRSAEIIQANAHQALVDLRHVLGVLRDDTGNGSPAGDRPQPTFHDLSALVDESVRSGMRVEYAVSVGAGEQMPEQVGRTVYRIVQEGLTNARKHAPGARVTLTVTGDPDRGVDVRVHNLVRPGIQPEGGPGATPGAGLGLVGLAERAQLAGGTLDHEQDGHAFTLHGWLPWSA